MEFLTFHNQLVADLPTDNEQYHLGPFNIIQHAKVAGAELKLRERVWP
jgi:hypothetical protein